MRRISDRPHRESLLFVFSLVAFFVLASQLMFRESAQAQRLPQPGQQQQPTPTPSRQQPQSTPTPSSLPGGLTGIFAAAKAEQIRLLNEEGPQFSPAFDTGKFNILAFVKGGWTLRIEYEMEDQSLAVMTIVALTDRGIKYSVHKLSGTGARRTESLQIPDDFSDKPEPSIILIETSINQLGKKKRVDFQLYGLGIGVNAERTRGRRRAELNPSELEFGAVGAQIMPVSYFVRSSDIFSHKNPLQSDVISGPTFAPSSFNASSGATVTYSFQALDSFGRWAADFRSVTRTPNADGRIVPKTKWVRTVQFDEAIGPSNQISKEWDGKDRRGRVSRGEHRLMIRAWWSAVNGGSSAIKIADQSIFVE